MNPLHSPRNEHSKTEFGKKNPEIKFGESETFSGSKFDPATGVEGPYNWSQNHKKWRQSLHSTEQEHVKECPWQLSVVNESAE